MNKVIAHIVISCYEGAMLVHGFVDEKHIKKERAKAKALRKSPWWKQKLSQGVCYYCEKSFVREDLTMDHKTPIARGGSTSKGNVVVSCKPCNNAKKFYTPAEMILQGQDAESLNSPEV